MFTLLGLLGTKLIFFSKKSTLVFLSLLVGSFVVQAYIPKAAFWGKHYSILQYSTSAQTLKAGNCSNAVTVNTYNFGGALTNVLTNLTVNLSSAGVTFYSDSDCLNSITTLTITTGTSSGTFYFIADTAGTKPIVSAATGYKPALQNQTLATNPFVWTGGGANALWSTGLNWSGGAQPSSADAALFDSTCVSNCSPSIDAAKTIYRIRMSTGYAGTINQSNNLTVVNGYVQAAGTFNAGSAMLNVGGDFNFAGGTFAAGTSTLYLSGTSYSSTQIKPGSANYFNVTIVGYACQYMMSGTLNVNGELYLGGTVGYSSPYINGGTILAKGNVTSNGSTSGSAGSVVLKIAGSSDQTITGANGFILPKTEITSTGGIIYLMGGLVFQDNFTYTSGTVNAGTSAVTFLGNGYVWADLKVSGLSFYDVTISGYLAGFVLYGTLDVKGSYTLATVISYGASYITGGAITVEKNLVFNNNGQGFAALGSTPLSMVGTTDAVITYTAGAFHGGPITINKTGGAKVTMTSNVTFTNTNQDLTITAGTLDMAGYNLNVTRNISNSGTLKRGNNPSCGTLTYGGSFTGTAAVCP